MTINVYADALRAVSTCKRTENGANAFSTTNDAVVDLFGTIGAMRNGDNSMERVKEKVDAAWAEDPQLTMRCIFYARDIRGGLGEREIFRKAIYHLAKTHPTEMAKNMPLIPEYGRWDDLFSLIGTPVEDSMWLFVKGQLREDTRKVSVTAPQGGSISLLAKWMPSADTSSKRTRELAFYAADKLGMSVYAYKRYIRNLRRHLRLLEQDMSAKNWKEIDYRQLPSQAHMRHVKAFHRNDGERYESYLDAVDKGVVKVNTQTLYPYEIVERIKDDRRYGFWVADKDTVRAMETMWKNLPDYVGDGGNVLVVADTSGSMMGRPMDISTSLAIYFAERNKGPFAEMYMTFSDKPQVIQLKNGDSLLDRYEQMIKGPWGQNTDLYRVFDFLIYIATQTKCPPEEMPKAVVIITDMEIDRCERTGQAEWNTIVDQVREYYEHVGYRMPNVVFWNVASRHDTYLARCDYEGVQMVSGSSASVFKAVLGFIDGMTPIEAVRQVLDGERYRQITV